MSMAFLIVDVQNKYVEDERFKPMFEKASMYINATSELFREHHCLVVHIQHLDSMTNPSQYEFQIAEKIIQKETDLYVTKTFSNGFWETDLDQVLKEHKIEFIVISGLSAGYCVLSTYNGAIERGYGAALLQHGLLANDKEELSFVESTRALISYTSINYFLNHSK